MAVKPSSRPYRRAQFVFGLLCLLSAGVFLLSYASLTIPPPGARPPSLFGDGPRLTALISLIATVLTLVAFLSTTFLSCRKERRAASRP